MVVNEFTSTADKKNVKEISEGKAVSYPVATFLQLWQHTVQHKHLSRGFDNFFSESKLSGGFI